MAHLTEGSPIRAVNELDLSKNGFAYDADRVLELEERFPGKVRLIPVGGIIYHHSRNPDVLVERGVFDSMQASSGDGSAFFCDMRAQVSNCQVEVARDLVLVNYSALTWEEMVAIRVEGGAGSFMASATKIGFDGHTRISGYDHTVVRKSEYGTEITVYKNRLRKLGKVSPLT